MISEQVKQFILDRLLTEKPMQLLRYVSALQRTPEATIDQLTELLESDRVRQTFGVMFTEEVAAGGIGVRAIHYPSEGDCFENHKHLYDHLTYLAKGSVIAHREGSPSKVFHAPRMIMTRAGIRHQFVANENDTHMMCLHRTDELEESGIPFTVVDAINQLED